MEASWAVNGRFVGKYGKKYGLFQVMSTIAVVTACACDILMYQEVRELSSHAARPLFTDISMNLLVGPEKAGSSLNQ